MYTPTHIYTRKSLCYCRFCLEFQPGGSSRTQQHVYYYCSTRRRRRRCQTDRQTDRQTAARHQQFLSSSASANPTVPFFPTSDCVALVHSATLTVDFPELGARTVSRGDDNPEPETERGAHLPQAGGRGGAKITGNFDLFFGNCCAAPFTSTVKSKKKPAKP